MAEIVYAFLGVCICFFSSSYYISLEERLKNVHFFLLPIKTSNSVSNHQTKFTIDGRVGANIDIFICLLAF